MEQLSLLIDESVVFVGPDEDDVRFFDPQSNVIQEEFAVPIEERMDDRELKKGILREAGKVLGAPPEVLKRRKRAMQYGSGIHKLLLKNSEEINRNYPAS